MKSPSPSPLPFTGPWLLAPMEGVTEPCFRDLVLEGNQDFLGGAFTEFLRVVDVPPPERTIRAHLGPNRFETPVGLQLMGSNTEVLARTAARAVELGAPLVDLNFGCPARGAMRGCAGSALLEDPSRLERIVSAVTRAVPDAPVTAKIRAGGEDDSLLEDLARSVEAGGAALLTVHCRTRREGYQREVDWSRIARACDAVGIPVCGNGGIERHADLEDMRRRTGCRYVMVGRAALADPWIFSGRTVSAGEAGEFLLAYAALLSERARFGDRGVAGRIKQLLNYWNAGDLVGDRRSWLRAKDPVALIERIAEASGLPPSFSPVP